VSFADVLKKFHEERYTGPVVIHFAQGQAKAVEIPNPTVIRFDRRGAQRAQCSLTTFDA
jgi:hypothetical protein